MKDELFESILKILKVYKILEGELDHISWIIHLFIFV